MKCHPYTLWDANGTRLQVAQLSRKLRHGKSNTWLIEQLPELAPFCERIYIPRILAPEQAPLVDARYFSGRNVLLEERVHIDLSTFGWAKPGTVQEFAIDVKGGGAQDHWDLDDRLHRAIHDCDDMAHRFKQRQNARKKGILDFSLHMLTHSYQGAKNDVRPFGSQCLGHARRSMKSTRRFQHQGTLKVAPVLCQQTLPNRVMRVIKKFSEYGEYEGNYSSGSMDGVLVQQLRLMPSNLRGYEFCKISSMRAARAVKRLAPSSHAQERLYKQLLKDSVPYFSVVPQAKKHGEQYHWTRIGDHHLSYATPRKFEDHTGAHYIAKDVVLASTGMYFVDMEGIRMPEKCHTKNELWAHQELYLLSTLRDCYQILEQFRQTQYYLKNEIMGVVQVVQAEKRIKKEVLTDLLNSISTLPHLSALQSRDGDEVRITVEYPHLNEQRDYFIPVEYLGYHK